MQANAQPDFSVLLRYDVSTGLLYWKQRSPEMFKSSRAAILWNARYAGEEAFTCADKDGYKVGSVLGNVYKAHRVVWLIEKGYWPKGTIDHLDGDRSNNRLANLRDVDWSTNCRNRSMGASNTSGMVGVSWIAGMGRWRAYIKVDGKLTHLGHFRNKVDAEKARLNALSDASDFTPRHGLPPG